MDREPLKWPYTLDVTPHPSPFPYTYTSSKQGACTKSDVGRKIDQAQQRILGLFTWQRETAFIQEMLQRREAPYSTGKARITQNTSRGVALSRGTACIQTLISWIVTHKLVVPRSSQDFSKYVLMSRRRVLGIILQILHTASACKPLSPPIGNAVFSWFYSKPSTIVLLVGL